MLYIFYFCAIIYILLEPQICKLVEANNGAHIYVEYILS